MKTTTKMMTSISLLLLTASPLLAATVPREDDSNVLVWAFLGICALIIFLQMVPVIGMAYGLIKGLFGGNKEGLEEELEVATSKYR